MAPEATKVEYVPKNGTVYIPGLTDDTPVLFATDASDIKIAGANSKDTQLTEHREGVAAASRPATYHVIEFDREGEHVKVHTNMPFCVFYNGKS